jgi:hypothetical protein
MTQTSLGDVHLTVSEQVRVPCGRREQGENEGGNDLCAYDDWLKERRWQRQRQQLQTTVGDVQHSRPRGGCVMRLCLRPDCVLLTTNHACG